MRIIDKNTDFYDFYQDVYYDKTFTFDRRDSFILTKEMICDSIYPRKYWSFKEKKSVFYRKMYTLLQVGNTFWLFCLYLKDFNQWGKPTDFEVELIDKWRNFDKERKLISLDIVSRWNRDLTKLDINLNDFDIVKSLNRHPIYIGKEREERHIPILKASGLASLIDPLDIFLAFEEYFSLEKSDSERREPIGTTDIDKVENHGFDKKTSFRGKC